jgi:hydrogenase maturation factor
MAAASGRALRLDRDAALWLAPGKAICEALGADPWGALASGALLAGFADDLIEAAETALRADGYVCARLGRAEPGAGVRADGGELPRFEQDEVSRILAG